jgi:hypothetical protein
MEKQNGFCVPFALSFISGKTPNEVADMIREERGDGRPVRGVQAVFYKAVLHQLGFKITASVRRPGMTIAKWAANRAKWADKSTWLVTNAGHAMIYRDGVIYDNGNKGGKPSAEHPYATARLRSAYQVSA